MVCRTSCAVSTAFIIGMIYHTNSSVKSEVVQTYEKQLPDHLRKVYGEIVEERAQIYYTGYILGLLLALILYLMNTQLLGIKYSTSALVCQTILISFVVNYFYYILTPKKQMMLDHIKSPEQIKAWLAMYKEMQRNYHTGMALGLVAVGIMAYAFRCVK